MTTITHPPRTSDWRAVATELAASALNDPVLDDRDGTLPVATLRRAADAGLTTALVPADHGGAGASYAEVGAAIRALARTDGSAAVTLAMHSHLVAFQVWRHRHGQEAGPFFEKVMAGNWFVSTGAADWISSSGTSRRVDGGFVVSARKAPASGCEIGTMLVTSARWEAPGEAPQVLHAAVPFANEGVSIEPTWDTMGLRATGSHTVVLDEVFVPDAAVSLVRPADVWHPVWNIVLGAAMPLIMAAYNGIADAAVDVALDLAGPAPDAAGVADVAAQLAGEMVTAHLVGSDAVDALLASSEDLRFDNTDAHSAAVLARKTTAAEAFVTTVDRAVELVGGRAYGRAMPLERLHRDVLGSRFHPLPRPRQACFTGRVALGLGPVA